MVFSPELGYDPEEWEECPESDHFLALGFFTRIWLTILTVGLAGAFFWVLEARKEWSKLDRDSDQSDVTTKEEKEPPPKPERRMSLEAMRAAEEMRREAAIAAAVAREDQEIQSPQRDARSSVSVERRLRQGASLTRDEVEAMLEADRKAAATRGEEQPISPEPPSSTFGLPSGAFDNITELQELERTQPQKKQSLEQQYRILAKAIERKLLAEIEQLGLLQGRHNEKDAPRQIAEQIQHKHRQEIDNAVDELVKREAGNVPHVADHFRRQLENQIEDAVWQYNQSLLHANTPKDLYETELGPDDKPIWKLRSQDQPSDTDFDFRASVLDRPQGPENIQGNVPLYQQPPQGLQVPPRESYQPVDEAATEPSSPKILINNQQKGSSSSEDGFIKVYNEPVNQAIPGHGYDDDKPGTVGSPRPSSYDAGSSVTADDIEFVHSAENSPRISGYPDVFEYEHLQRVEKSRPSDDLEGFETIPSQNIWQQQQGPAEIEVPKKPLNPEEAAHMAQLLKEYDLNSLRESEPDTWQQQQKAAVQPDQRQMLQQAQQQLPLTAQDVWQEHPSREQPNNQQYEFFNEGEIMPFAPNSRTQVDTQLSPVQLPPDNSKDWAEPHPAYDDEQKQFLQQQAAAPPSPKNLQQPQTPTKRSKSKSPVQVFNEGDNIAEYLFQMAPKPKQSSPNEQATFIFQTSQQGQTHQVPTSPISPQSKAQEPDDDPRRLVEADIYVQDAIDYIESQRPATSQSGGTGNGFVIEEEMLESDKLSPHGTASKGGQVAEGPNLSELEKQLKSPSEAAKHSQQNVSADPTSRMIHTNEVFTRPEPSFDDADDAITSAPEIQSIEIPPDQMSENSSNIMDNYDFQPGSSGAYSPSPLLIEPVPTSIPNNLNNREVHYVIDNDRLIAAGSSPSPRQRNQAGARSPEAPQLWRVSPVPYDEPPSLSISERHIYKMRKQSSLLSVLNVTSMQEMLLTLTSLEGLAAALRRAGLESTNLIFGIDYTASNKYQGENSFGGRSLHLVDDPSIENPYQKVIRIMGNSLASFATSGSIPVYGFGDASTGDWSVFKLRESGECQNLEEVLRVYNEVTPKVELSGPTNFAPLIYEGIKICQRIQDYHILVIIADGQVTNERATRKAIVKACEYPLSIIVVGVGDGPFPMMRVFDESLPKRPWDNFHFVEFNEIVREEERSSSENELAFAIQSLLEIPDQYAMIRRLGLLGRSRAD